MNEKMWDQARAWIEIIDGCEVNQAQQILVDMVALRDTLRRVTPCKESEECLEHLDNAMFLLMTDPDIGPPDYRE